VPPGLDTGDWVEQPVPTVPQRGWADVSDGAVGLLVANRGLPEVEFMPGEGQVTIALTLLRCVGWLSRGDLRCRQGHAGPELATPEAQCIGDYVFHYALVPHDGGWQAARDQAEGFLAPLRTVVTGLHAGDLPLQASLVEVEPASFVLTTIKQPEGRSHAGLLVRGFNLGDRPVTVRLRPRYRFDRIARVDLNEDFVEPLLAHSDGSVTFSVRPWEIVSVRWED
jgi:alpha-mannosidase